MNDLVKKLREVSNSLNAINDEVLQLSFKLDENDVQVPESDMISRSHLLKTFYNDAFTKAKPGGPETYEQVYASTVEAVIRNEPPATPAREKSQWTFDPLGGDWICTVCGNHSMEHGNYCSNCGAEME